MRTAPSRALTPLMARTESRHSPHRPGPEPSTGRRTLLRLRWLASVGGAVFVFDQALKALIRWSLPLGGTYPLLPGVLQLSHVRNTGAAFSLFQEEPIGLLVVSCVLYVLVLLYSVRKPHLSRLETLSLGIILGGAGGNLLDRVLWGGVVDYIDVVAIHYPVFNLADTAIVFGMLGLVLASL